MKKETSKRWAATSDPVFDAVEDGKIGAVDGWVYTCIARYAHFASKKAWPSIPRIAKKSRKSERTVRRSIKKLKAAGLIVVSKNWNNTYYLPHHPDFGKKRHLEDTDAPNLRTPMPST